MNNNQEQLNRNHNELIELKYVLQKDDEFFYEAGHRADEINDDSLLLRSNTLDEDDRQISSVGTSTNVKLAYASTCSAKGFFFLNLFLIFHLCSFVSGVVTRGDNFQSFERVLFRATRGNLFMRFSEIEEPIKDPKTGELLKKLVFIIFFQGERLATKIKRICESFGANLYPCPETANERKDLLAQVNMRLDDLRVVISRTLEHRRQVLTSVGANVETWLVKVRKEKAIYHTMNMFNYDLGRRCLIAEGWCPKTATEEIQLALRKARVRFFFKKINK